MHYSSPGSAPSSTAASRSRTSRLLNLVLLVGCILFSGGFFLCMNSRGSMIREQRNLKKENEKLSNDHVDYSRGDDDTNSARQTSSKKTPCPVQIEKNQKNLPRAVTALRYRIVVFTYLRPDGLRRLLKSLVDAYYPAAARVAITILLDFPKDKKMQKEENVKARRDTLDILKNFVWPHGDGEVTIHRRQQNMGLKKNILEAWYPPADNGEVCATFEDDIEVSPFWFEWTLAGIEKYYLSTSVPEEYRAKLLGLSLYRPVHDEQSRRSCVVDNDHKPYLLQQPCSWGAVFFPRTWRAFRDWYDEFVSSSSSGGGGGGGEPIVITERHEQPDANTWPSSSSWKKYLIKKMHESGWAMVYPNLPKNFVFSTNHLMKGEHNLPNRKLFELPLLDVDGAKSVYDEQRVRRFILRNNRENNDKKNDENSYSPLILQSELPSLNSLKCFDVMFNEEKGGVAKLMEPKRNLAPGGGGGQQQEQHQEHHHRHHHHEHQHHHHQNE